MNRLEKGRILVVPSDFDSFICIYSSFFIYSNLEDIENECLF